MKIKYKILWIDDQPDSVETHVDAIKRELHELGFDLDLDKRTSISEDDLYELETQLGIYNPYDLVVFDYDLGKNKMTGADLALALRRIIYTDMIFYSAKANIELRQILCDKQVDGVYVVNRTALHTDVPDLIRDQVKRICDLNSMRGIVLAEMSKLDAHMRKLLVNKFRRLETTARDKQISKMKDRLAGRAKSYKERADSMAEEKFLTDVLDPLAMEYSWVQDRLQSIGAFGQTSKDTLDLLIGMQKLRNEMAHQDAIFDENKGRIFLTDSKDFAEGFDHDYFIKIRKNIRAIADEIANLITMDDT